jgi:hypothetical protein
MLLRRIISPRRTYINPQPNRSKLLSIGVVEDPSLERQNMYFQYVTEHFLNPREPSRLRVKSGQVFSTPMEQYWVKIAPNRNRTAMP